MKQMYIVIVCLMSILLWGDNHLDQAQADYAAALTARDDREKKQLLANVLAHVALSRPSSVQEEASRYTLTIRAGEQIKGL